MSFEKLLNLYNTADENRGMQGGEFNVLPKGKYPVEIEKINSKDVTRDKGTPRVRMQLRVLEGPYENRRAFVDMYMSKVDETTVELVSSAREARLEGEEPSEAAAKAERFFNASMTFLKVLNIPPADPSFGDEDPNLAFYNVGLWEGQQFLASIGVETAEKQQKAAEDRGVTLDDARDRNRLSGWDYMNADTMHEWSKRELERQRKAFEKEKANAAR